MAPGIRLPPAGGAGMLAGLASGPWGTLPREPQSRPRRRAAEGAPGDSSRIVLLRSRALSVFSAADLAQLAARGIPPAEAERQLALLSAPPPAQVLDRPCTVADGIVRLDPAREADLLARHARDAAAGRVLAFVPASGAATRMFKDLLAPLGRPGDVGPAPGAAGPESAAVAAFVGGLTGFAFHDALVAALGRRGLDAARLREAGPWRPLLEALLEPEGLDYARLPKALLAFHRTPAGVRTALEEHLVESVALARDQAGTCRLHFTVSPEHRAGFEQRLAASRPALEAALGARWEVTLSEQHPATDTLAGDPAGGPFRDDAGRLLFRPAGHGALLRNLDEIGGDLVFLKNVDNVAVDVYRTETTRWTRLLVARASELAERAHALRARLDDAGDAAAAADARAFLAAEVGEDASALGRDALAARLDRPVRVCGMVPNTGEPGGGPFWVRGADGAASAQIVESAQVSAEPAQQAILKRATHFNPVFLACALRDRHGRAHDLDRFVDERAVIVTRKSAGGRDLLALERPGLWNGAMAGWLTSFVEVPLAVFNPVKTVLDLLRPEHQG